MKSSKPARNMQSLFIEINLKQIVHPVGSYCTDLSRCTVNKILNFIFMSEGQVNVPCSEPVGLMLYPHILFGCTNFAVSGFRGLEAACWPLVPKFAASNPAEAFGIFGRKKSSARLPSKGK
jgi:hypothetical protein